VVALAGAAADRLDALRPRTLLAGVHVAGAEARGEHARTRVALHQRGQHALGAADVAELLVDDHEVRARLGHGADLRRDRRDLGER
jgi:hypothetical protein